jgi:hypothetical protein
MNGPTAGGGDVVTVARAHLRGFRTSVAGVLVALAVLGAGLVAMLVDDQQRCEAGNDFRRRDLPAAFALHDQRLGEALGASDAQIADFDTQFRAELAELFPERDCTLL